MPDYAIIHELKLKFGEGQIGQQLTVDEMPTIWVSAAEIKNVLSFLKNEIPKPFKMLYDLTAVDERMRQNRIGIPDCDFSIVYHLTSFGRNQDIRIKVPLKGEFPLTPSITSLWENANWYEREAFDMFGIKFDGHPHLRRILMPTTWQGHPLRKEYPARGTEAGPFTFTEEDRTREEEALKFVPEEWGMKRESEDAEFMFLNLGPDHPGTHGLLRLILQLDGEEIIGMVPDIGYHHRGAEKMGERQTWHKYIPYTDRVDYTSGVLNNLAYLLTLEKMAGIKIPDRAQMIRVMTTELFRIISHLVWYGTFAQDLGQISPVFYTFNDRERAFDIISSITGGRMHPNWFRIGGVAQDLPNGWQPMILDFIKHFRKSLNEWDKVIMQNRIIKARTIGIGAFNTDEAIEWGITGPALRATGFEWDLRKKRPYSGFEQFEFDIPTGKNGDCYDRARVRVEEMRQSLRIIEQCVKLMPDGYYKSDHPLTTPPRKEKTLKDIETLITHFLGVTWGPVIPAGEGMIQIESSKGSYGYYLISDHNTSAYRSRIRTPSFPHIQMVPYISKGYTVADILAILGAVDFVLADLDR
jgi:NADH-quinone oxidoreductase subunit C/D